MQQVGLHHLVVPACFLDDVFRITQGVVLHHFAAAIVAILSFLRLSSEAREQILAKGFASPIPSSSQRALQALSLFIA